MKMTKDIKIAVISGHDRFSDFTEEVVANMKKMINGSNNIKIYRIQGDLLEKYIGSFDYFFIVDIGGILSDDVKRYKEDISSREKQVFLYTKDLFSEIMNSLAHHD